MTSIMEFTIADEAAASINESGVCSHACSAHIPLAIAKPEADDLNRFDPEAFQKLITLGVIVHDVEVSDFEYIGGLAHLEIIRRFDHRTDKKLHKHAIAIRLDYSLLIANMSPEKPMLEAVCQAFGNPYQIL